MAERYSVYLCGIHAGSAFDVTETTQPMPPETRSWYNMAAILCRFSNFHLVIDTVAYVIACVEFGKTQTMYQRR